MYCIHCGRELIENAAFCAFCGRPVSTTSHEATEKSPQDNEDFPVDEELPTRHVLPGDGPGFEKTNSWTNLIVGVLAFFAVGVVVIDFVDLSKSKKPQTVQPESSSGQKPEVSKKDSQAGNVQSGKGFSKPPSTMMVNKVAYIRTSPGPGAQIIRGAKYGDFVMPVETRGEWTKVNWSDGQGWIQTSALAGEEARKANEFKEFKTNGRITKLVWRNRQISVGMTYRDFERSIPRDLRSGVRASDGMFAIFSPDGMQTKKGHRLYTLLFNGPGLTLTGIEVQPLPAR